MANNKDSNTSTNLLGSDEAMVKQLNLHLDSLADGMVVQLRKAHHLVGELIEALSTTEEFAARKDR
jgi:hypothetical protein